MKADTKEARREELKAKKYAYVQEELLAAAAVLFAERGYRAVAIDDIAESVGSAKSVIYYYFKSKNEILWKIFTKIYDSYFEMVSSALGLNLGPRETLRQIIINHAVKVTQQTSWTAIYFREERELDEQQRELITMRKRKYDAAIEEVYRKGVQEGVFRDMPPHIVVSGIMGMCNWLYTWFREGGAYTTSEVAECYASLLSEGYLVGPAIRPQPA